MRKNCAGKRWKCMGQVGLQQQGPTCKRNVCGNPGAVRTRQQEHAPRREVRNVSGHALAMLQRKRNKHRTHAGWQLANALVCTGVQGGMRTPCFATIVFYQHLLGHGGLPVSWLLVGRSSCIMRGASLELLLPTISYCAKSSLERAALVVLPTRLALEGCRFGAWLGLMAIGAVNGGLSIARSLVLRCLATPWCSSPPSSPACS